MAGDTTPSKQTRFRIKQHAYITCEKVYIYLIHTYLLTSLSQELVRSAFCKQKLFHSRQLSSQRFHQIYSPLLTSPVSENNGKATTLKSIGEKIILNTYSRRAAREHTIAAAAVRYNFLISFCEKITL